MVYDGGGVKVLCPQCERLITLERFRVEGAALVVTCGKCGAESRVEPGAAEQGPAPAPEPRPAELAGPVPAPRLAALPPRVSLASVEGVSNVVVLRTAGHEAVARAAAAADAGPFAIPEGVCPKCVAKRVEAPACPHCGIRYETFDEAALLPPRWLRDDWVALLRDWGNEARHAQLRRKAQQADALAAVGRLYRLRQAFTPEDPVAELGRGEVLRMAAVAISFRPPSDDVDDKRRKLLVVVGVTLAALLIAALVAQLLRGAPPA